MQESIQAWMVSHQAITIKVFIILFAALVLNYAVQKFLLGLKRQFKKTANPWDDALADSLSKPVAYGVAILGISFAIGIVNQGVEGTFLFKVLGLRNLLMLGLLAWFLIRFVQRGEKVFIARIQDAHEITTIVAMAKLARLSILITVALMGMQALGYSVEGVLAFGGVGGIAIGFAAKDLLANFFGGLMIYLDRPFVVGDWVRSPDKSIEGTVEQIGWRLTVIRTFDKRPLYVPNSIFASIAIENPSRMSNRRIKETIGLRYDDTAAIEPIINDVRAMLKNHDDIDATQTLIVNFDAFAASSLDFFIYTFTKTTDWIEFHHIKQDILLKILAIVESHGAEVAFPTSTILLNQQEAMINPELGC
ncbi:MAG: mechanosensitive ion channel family protein [Sinobacterium sp.]|nr:mechanosensitive ion channel family protein [Sinobacterium sp.]